MKIIICIFAVAALTMANNTTDVQRMLKNSNDQFTAQMFNEVVKANPDKSVVLSAFSVLSPLAQLAVASVGESHTEILHALGFPYASVAVTVMNAANQQMRSVKGITLETANKIYVADGYTLNEGFAVLSKDNFNSEVQNLNFGNNKEAVKTINTWVEDHTNARIKDLVTPDMIDAGTLAVLVNAIYFKGSWKNKFLTDFTENRPFHVNKDKTIEVPTMYRSGYYAYGESVELNAKLLEIPYEGEESSFLIVLPNNIGDIQALANKLKDFKVLERAQENMHTTEVDLYLPKFKIDTTTDLVKVLRNMNVKKLFSPEARLDMLLKDATGLYITDAKQKAFIEINEEGAEAAAANVFALAALTFANDTDLQTMLKNSNDQFTAQMFNEVAKANPDKSFVLSAFSVLPPLAQLALASVGESHDELLKAIGFPSNNVTVAVMTDLNRGLRTIKGVTLEMANKIYVADGYTLNDQFAVLSKDVFNSEVQNLNFGNTKEAAKIINTWVEDHTNQRIKDLVSPDSLDDRTVSVLVNAIYFKGIWKDKFYKHLTQNRPFHVTKDKTIQVPTMYRRGHYAYGESAELDAKLLKIPYEGEESSFLIVLPNNVGDIQALGNKLKDIKLLEKAQQSMYETEVYVYLPKFKIETTSKLKDVLQKMNVKKMFSRVEARLDNLLIDTKNIFVSDAIQKAFIEVNEGGAEAAAAGGNYNYTASVFKIFGIIIKQSKYVNRYLGNTIPTILFITLRYLNLYKKFNAEVYNT